jgi:hypothetical protein
MTKENIIQTIKLNKGQFLNFHIRKIGLFGSFVRNQANDDSDIDFLIDFDKNSQTTLSDLIKIEEMLESLFNRKIDLALLRKLKPHISKNILNEVEYII